jgi:hypothetical protein
VDAIDENNVWAVGVIATADSDSVWHNPHKRHNAVKWNGNEFEYYQLEVISGGGNYYIQDLQVALTFAKNNIWFFSADGYVHWDGSTWKTSYINGSKGILSGWGASGKNFYLIGHLGYIVHYNGIEFITMDCGIDKKLHDITGYVDPETGLTNLWVAGEELLLHYDGKTWTTVWDENTPLLPERSLLGAVYVPDSKHLITTPWIYPQAYGYCINTKDNSELNNLFKTDVSGLVMDGMGLNDIFVGGKSNRISHYNGNSIMEYPELENFGNSHGIVYKNNNVFMVGSLGGQQGIFIHGKKIIKKR